MSKEIKVYSFEISAQAFGDGYIEARSKEEARRWVKALFDSWRYDFDDIEVYVHENSKPLQDSIRERGLIDFPFDHEFAGEE